MSISLTNFQRWWKYASTKSARNTTQSASKPVEHLLACIVMEQRKKYPHTHWISVFIYVSKYNRTQVSYHQTFQLISRTGCNRIAPWAPMTPELVIISLTSKDYICSRDRFKIPVSAINYCMSDCGLNLIILSIATYFRVERIFLKFKLSSRISVYKFSLHFKGEWFINHLWFILRKIAHISFAKLIQNSLYSDSIVFEFYLKCDIRLKESI